LKSIFFTLMTFFVIAFAGSAQAAISHIEWAASNYAGVHPGDPQKQFSSLRASLDELLLINVPEGVIYINDIDQKGLIAAIDFAGHYLTAKGIPVSYEVFATLGEDVPPPRHGIVLVSYPGDLFTIPVPHTETANLRNPEPTMVLLELLRESGRHRLAEMAYGARRGLNIVTYEPTKKLFPEFDFFTPLKEFNEVPMKRLENYYDFSDGKGELLNYLKYHKFNLRAVDCNADLLGL
jgi:hypothetical protein